MAIIIGGFSPKSKFEIKDVPFKASIHYSKNNLSIYAGGESLISFVTPQGEKYIIAGSALDEDYTLMGEDDWKKYFKKNENHTNIKGHYLIIKILENEIHINNDQLGLRELFIYKSGDEICFSTRLDYLIEFIDSSSLNYNYLCSLWNLETPLVKETLVENVKIIGQGAQCKISANGLDISQTPWSPIYRKSSIQDIINILSNILDSLINSNKELSLGFSGGIDSRTILSLLLDYDRNLWRTHTFGQITNFDVKIANAIAKVKKFDHYHHDIKKYGNDEIFGSWMVFVKETNCLVPAHYYHELSYYKVLPKDEFFIDGGKGEYLRRGLSNRLAKLGKRALLNNNTEKIMKYLFLKKPDIFSKDVTKQWDEMLKIQIAELLQNMPDISEFGIENWIDIYNIRYRTGNVGYVTQTRMDGIIQNLMPLVQPDILHSSLNLEPKVRLKEKINRKIINKQLSLKLFPLARYNTIIPFQYNKYTSLIWGQLNSKFIKEKSDDLNNFLELNKDYILSRLSDRDFTNSSLYDQKKIRKRIQRYYNGKTVFKDFIVWWMAFDIWHQLIHKN